MTGWEIHEAHLKNAMFLRRYDKIASDPGIEEHLASTLVVLGDSTPRLLLEASFSTFEWRALSIPHLWRMVLQHRIHVNLLEPLTMESEIFIINGEGFTCDPHSWGWHLG